MESRLLLAAAEGLDSAPAVMGPLPPEPMELTGQLVKIAESLYRKVGPLLPEQAEIAGLYARRIAQVDSGKPLHTVGIAPGVVDREAGDTPRIRMPRQDTQSLIARAHRKQLEQGVFSFAAGIPIDINPGVHGLWGESNDGMRRWKVQIVSEHARSINLGFDRYVMPVGGQLVITGQDGMGHRFTESDNEEHGELWTPIIVGQSLTLEVTVPTERLHELELRVGKVNHGFRDHRGNDKIGGDTSGACNIDVVCDANTLPGIGASIDQYRDQIRSVAAYTVGGIDTCSGALVNNTAEDGTPYFLTANHCNIDGANAPSMVVYWNFECTTCRQPGSVESGGVGDGSLDQFNSGAIFRAAHNASDFALVELDDPIDLDFNVFYAGWDRSGADATSAVAIHHPAVAEKRISFEFDPTTTTSYSSSTVSASGTHIRVADWDAGTTEGGSSGSPLFDQNKRIIGQLHGGFAACGNDQSDWYGKLSVSWDGGGTSSTRLSDWLDPLGTDVITIDGVDLTHDFGDAPDDPYGTLLGSNGPRHRADGPRLGAIVNADRDGTPGSNALGDRGDDGVRLTAPLVTGTTATLRVASSPGGGQLNFFFDFDGIDGFGNHPNEIFSVSLSGGTELIPITIPADAVTGLTYARFRISSAGDLGPLGEADDGEVEDYRFPIFDVAPPLDFGDAPEGSYATLLAGDGPRHVISGPQLGPSVDAESDGQPNDTATGDGVDDDGVIFRSPLVRDSLVDISILSSGGQLDFFFDFDADGTFGNQSGEAFSAVLAPGEQTVTVQVPADAALGVTKARFRISSDGGLTPTGLASDGEVEDYQVMVIDPNLIWSEYFDSVTGTGFPAGWTSTSTGPNPWDRIDEHSDTPRHHAFVENIGTVSDSRLTTPSILVDTSDSVVLSYKHHYQTEAGFDGGVLEMSLDGGPFTDVTAAGATFLVGGYNLTLNGDHDNPLSDRDAWSGNSDGYSETRLLLPPTAAGANVRFRWRLGTDSSESAVGWRVDTIRLTSTQFTFDYGDAPDPTLPTLAASDGARHLISSLYFGSDVDADPDGQPSTSADGDDNDGGDDEDGVLLPAQWTAGDNVIEVTASQAGLLNAWIDVSDDGSFSGEQFIKDHPVAAGTHSITVSLPPVSSAVTADARFRLSTQSALWYDGAAPDGEVEDYQIMITQSPPRVAEVIINDGDPQRSSIKKVTVKFDSRVDIDFAGGDPFQFTQIGSADSILDTPTSSINGDGKTVVDFVFASGGPHVGPGGTLEDGRYQLLIDSSLITAAGVALDGDEDGSEGGDHSFTDHFFRKFGDQNGNDLVDLFDFASFRRTFDKSAGETGYLDSFDGDGNESIGLLDFTQFRRQFGN